MSDTPRPITEEEIQEEYDYRRDKMEREFRTWEAGVREVGVVDATTNR